MATKISGIILVLAVSIFVFGCSVATGQIQTVVVLSAHGQIIQEPSYTVWTKGGVYYANNTYGAIAYSSSVASNVLNYASAGLTTGGKIHVEDGVYTLTSALCLSNPRITLEGNSWNTIFKLANDVNDKVIVVEGNNCTISDLQIDGNYQGQTSSYSNGILVYYVNNTMINDVCIHDTYDEGVEFQGAFGGWFVNSYIYHTQSSGFVAYGSNNMICDNDTVTNSGLGIYADNLWFSSCTNCVASNLILETASDCNFEIQGGGVSNTANAVGDKATNVYCSNAINDGIYIDGKSTYPVINATISNFEIYNCTGEYGIGVNLEGYVQDSIIENGTIQNTVLQGIYIYNNCAGNIIRNIKTNATGTSGVTIDTACTNNTIDDVTATNAGVYGLQIDAGCTNNVIENSTVISSTNAGVIIWANNNMVENTLVESPNAIGIYLITCNYCTISGNTIVNPSDDGINIDAGTTNVISNNYIFNIPSGKNGITGTGAYCINDLIIDNYINCTTASGRTGIAFWAGSNGTTGNIISQNTIYHAATGINLMTTGVNDTILDNNQLISCSTPITDSGANTVIYNNTGYNPVGYITYPFFGNNHILLDLCGDNATWSSAVTYTNWESPKTLYISGGTVTAVVQDGQTIFSTTGCTVVLQPGDTFSLTFSSAPTIKVVGQ
ncbi:MAG: right-handed parallel beta-helix repeat-containing protein [Candidatus Bathyarchaeia archaeon]|jgi:parallel beta-helix repeat protein